MRYQVAMILESETPLTPDQLQEITRDLLDMRVPSLIFEADIKHVTLASDTAVYMAAARA